MSRSAFSTAFGMRELRMSVVMASVPVAERVVVFGTYGIEAVGGGGPVGGVSLRAA